MFKYFVVCTFFFLSISLFGQIEYPIPKEALERLGVKKGEVLGPFFNESKQFPNTEHAFWIYVPANYTAKKPPCLTVSFDGINMANKWRLPIIFDNLIHDKIIPPTIGVFISPGVIVTRNTDSNDKPNRSVEYDATGAGVAKLVLGEILPKVYSKYKYSLNSNDHLVMGNSSGGNAAFNLAWERPDFCKRVFSGVGSFTGLRSGHDFPVLIRKTHHEAMRVFVQDGTNDLNNFSGQWWWVNQHMASSLKWAGHQVTTAWGEDTHGYRHAASLMPEILTWLWEGYPQKIKKTKEPKREVSFLKEEEEWNLVLDHSAQIQHLESNANGEVHFSAKNILFLLKNGKAEKCKEFKKEIKAFSLTIENNIFVSFEGKNEVQLLDAKFKTIRKVKGIAADGLLATTDGFYWFNTMHNELGNYKKGKHEAYSIPSPTGIAINPEKSFLHVNSAESKQGYAVLLDSLDSPISHFPYYFYQVTYPNYETHASSLTVEQTNSNIACTDLGLQVADQLGRVQLIVPLPNAEIPSQVCFGGKDLSEIFVSSGAKIWSIKTNTKGFKATNEAIEVDKPWHIKREKR